MYINFWYPMIRSEDLGPDKPERAKVLGLNFAVFRDSKGEAHVLSDTCVHRGGSLGGAWELGKKPRIVRSTASSARTTAGNSMATGDCKNIPSIGYGTKPPARAKVDAYPTVEKYGIVFAFLGDLPENERPPLLNIEECDDPAWRANSVLVLDVDYYYERSIENGLDPAHNEFVHPTHGFKGINRETYKVRDYEVENYAQGWGMWFLHRFNAPGLKDKTWKEAQTKAGGLYAGSGTHGPNTMITEINVGQEPEVPPVLLRAAGRPGQDAHLLRQHAQLHAGAEQRRPDPRAQQGHRPAGHRDPGRRLPAAHADQQHQGSADAGGQGRGGLSRVAERSSTTRAGASTGTSSRGATARTRRSRSRRPAGAGRRQLGARAGAAAGQPRGRKAAKAAKAADE